MTDEAKYTATLKGGKDFDAPWLVIRADDEVELELSLETVEKNGTLATLGRVATAFGGQYQLGRQLDAKSVNAPVNAPAPAEDPYAISKAPATSPAWGSPAPAAAPPGVPIVLGQPAKLITSKPGAQREWKAWADPRPQAVTRDINEKTNDPNDPRLAQGLVTYWDWIR